jgi:endonuclease YncB( thermonuclease family)
VNLRPAPIAFVVLTLSLSSTNAQAPPRGSGWMPVTGSVRVIDADTLEVDVDGRRVGIAVAGIIAPQGNTACGREAIEATQMLVANGIELFEDLGLPAMDKRRRRVYRVSLSSGRSLAEELTRGGYAWPDPDAGAALEYLSIVSAATEARVLNHGCVWKSVQ